MSDEMTKAAQRLADVLAGENDALQRLDFIAAAALVPAKEAALAELTKCVLPRSQPSPLAELGRLLSQLAAENQTLLERAIAVQTRIVRIVARASVPGPAASRYADPGRHLPPVTATAVAVSTRA